MADRKTSVTLELRASQFKAETASAAKSVDGLDRFIEALDRDVEELGRDSVKTAAEVAALGGAAKKTGRDVDDLGKRTDETSKKIAEGSDNTKTMRSRMDELEASLKKTGAEFARTADPDLLKKFKADSSELRGLESAISKMEKLGLNVKQLGLEASKTEGLFASLQSGFEGGITSPAGLGLAGAAAVPALATVGGASLGLVGAAGAGAGVAAAVMGDPKAFKSAWDEATAQVKKDFLAAGNAFAGPTMDAIKTIGPTIDSWHLSQALAPAAKYVPILVDGLERAATGVEHGIADGIAKAGPAVKALSDGLAQLGEAAGDALSHIADGAEGGAQALHDTLTGVSAIVEGFGLITEGAEKAYEFVNDHPLIAAGFTAGLSIPASLLAKALGDVDQGGQAVGRTLNGVKTTIDETGHSVALTADDFEALAKGIGATKITSDTLAGQMSDKLFSGLLAVDQATLGWHEALTGVTQSLKDNGLSLDENTAKGQANVSAIYGAVNANIQAYNASIASGHSAIEAAAAYDQNTAALEKQLRKAGLTQGQIDGLIGTYAKVPDAVNTDIKVYGIVDAIDYLGDMLARLLHIDGYVAHAHVVVDETYIANRQSTYSEQVPRYKAKGGIDYPHRFAAAGMVVPPRNPGWTLFGEPQTGGEAFIPLRGISPDRAMSLAQTVGNAYGFSVVPRGGGGNVDARTVTYVINDASDPERVVAAIKRYEQRNGADWRSTNRR